MKKKIIIGIISSVVLFVILDYFELFRTIHIDGARVIRVRFKFSDSEGDPVKNVSIKAFSNNHDLKGRFVYDDDPSIVYGQIGIGASWKRTLFFRKPNPHNREIDKTEIKFVFQHPDFQEQEKIFLIRDFKKEAHKIILQPKEQADE
jgi:hypothetical protein